MVERPWDKGIIIIIMYKYRYSYTGYDAYGRTAWTAEVNSKEEPTETQIEEHKIHYTYDAEDKVTAIAYAMATEENV